MSLSNFLSDASSQYFVNTSWFGETLTLYPGGDPQYPSVQVVTAVVDRAGDQGSNEVEGDGRVLERVHGRALRHSVMLEMSVWEDVDDRRNPPDLLKIGGEMFAVKRILGRDDDVMTVLAISTTPLHTRRAARKG